MSFLRRREVALASAAIAATVIVVLAIYGTEETGLRAVIRATARTSAICIALAVARIRTREFLVTLPVSHAMHYAAILALALTTTASNAHIGASTIGGLAIFLLMIWTAMRPAVWQMWALWAIFAIGFGIRDMSMPVYPAVMVMLFVAAVVRFLSLPARKHSRMEGAP